MSPQMQCIPFGQNASTVQHQVGANAAYAPSTATDSNAPNARGMAIVLFRLRTSKKSSVATAPARGRMVASAACEHCWETPIALIWMSWSSYPRTSANRLVASAGVTAFV